MSSIQFYFGFVLTLQSPYDNLCVRECVLACVHKLAIHGLVIIIIRIIIINRIIIIIIMHLLSAVHHGYEKPDDGVADKIFSTK